MSEGVFVGEVSEVLQETAKAILVVIDGEELWVPKSVIHADSEVWDTDHPEGDLVVAEWFAEKEGLG